MMKSFLHLDLDGLPFCAMNITLKICLDTTYFVENWKLIVENTVTKYFLNYE